MTIKNYNTDNGLSAIISESSNESEFLIKGPMGRGLGLGNGGVPSGDYVAFAAGTGVLPFIDLAAYILLNNTGSLP